MRPPRKRRSHRVGFTLMEVLLVLAILVILGSMVAISISGVQKSAYDKSATIQIDAFKGMLKIYRLDVGSYPTSNQGLAALWACPADISNPKKWHGPYADEDEKEVPLDPWGNPYQYESDGQQIRIWSWGADGLDGTDDDISN